MIRTLSIRGCAMLQNSNMEHLLKKEEFLFVTFNELIKHHDEQLTKYHKFYLTALGSLIPLMGFFVKFEFHWTALIGVLFLAISLATNWILNSKKLNLEISEQEYGKQKSLYEKGGVTLLEMRNSEVSKINAQDAYEQAEIQLAKMSIVAPFSGVIVNLPYYTEGVRVATNQTMVELMSYDKMYVEINLPEKNISEIKVGQEVIITNYTLTEDTITGTVTELSPLISTETRTFTGKLQLDNPELKLRPGMFIKADIITAQKDSAIVIPKNVILTGSRGKYVFVVGRNSSADDRRITTGIDNQDYVEVLEGLQPNDRLIIRGFETLRDNSKVKVIQ